MEFVPYDRSTDESPKELVFRSQGDRRQLDLLSDLCSLDIDPDEDVTRQEFLEDTQVEAILRRHMMGQQVPGLRPASYGVVDYDLTFQGAMEAREAARQMFESLPLKVREHFGNWGKLAEWLVAHPEGGSYDLPADPSVTPKGPQAGPESGAEALPGGAPSSGGAAKSA